MPNMKPRSVKPLELIEMEKISTPRLLSFLRKLQQCENDIESSDWSPEEIAVTGGIVFKSSDEWQEQYLLVKSVLEARPNSEK